MTHSSHSHRITGHQARDLLDGATPGPWLVMDYEHAFRSIGPIYGDSLAAPEVGDGYLVCSDADATLAAAAPSLAETVAWLYGKPLTTDSDGDFYEAPHGGYTYAEDAKVDVNIPQGPFTPDEAVDLARALLAAAEDARP